MKEFIGTVVSAKNLLTATVRIDRKTRHPLYKKTMTRSVKLKSHNSLGAKEGDKVKVVETRPISKEKHFRIIEVLVNHG